MTIEIVDLPIDPSENRHFSPSFFCMFYQAGYVLHQAKKIDMDSAERISRSEHPWLHNFWPRSRSVD